MFQRLWPVSLASLIALAILITLGTWQMQRLEWKEALIAAAESRASLRPDLLIAEEHWSRLDAENFIYLSATAIGEYLPVNLFAYTVINTPQNGLHRGQGYWVMTPMRLSDGGVVFVNRGFIPIDQIETFAATLPPEGEVTVTALMKADEPPMLFTPPPSLERGIFYSRDLMGMAEAAGVDTAELAPFYLDARESGEGGLPQGGETVLTFTNNHLGYALTWYGLALTLIGVAGVFIFRIVREERAKKG